MHPAASRDYTAGKPANGDVGALPKKAGTVPVDVGNAKIYFFPSLGSHQIVHQTIDRRAKKTWKYYSRGGKEVAELHVSPSPPPSFPPQPALPLNVQPNSNKTTTRMSPVMVAYFHAYLVYRCRLGLPTGPSKYLGCLEREVASRSCTSACMCVFPRSIGYRERVMITVGKGKRYILMISMSWRRWVGGLTGLKGV